MDETRTTPEKLVRNVMSPSPVTVGSDATVRDAARLLADGDVGALPVTSGGKLIGIVTDRDLVVRVLAGDLDLSAPIGEIASGDLCSVAPDASLDEAARLLGQAQVRRLPVVDAEGDLVGIITQADVARNAGHELTGQAVAQISVPGAVGLDARDQALAESHPASDPPSGPASVGGLRGG
jgi:CBS domain-containing protein